MGDWVFAVRTSMLFRLTVFLGLSLSASGTPLYLLDFNTDGVLPSAQGFTYSSSTSVPEASVYSVSGGLLHQDTLATITGNHSYTWGGTLDSSLRTILEARLDVLTLDAALFEQSGGVYFQALDGVYRYSLFFDADGVRIPVSGGPAAEFVLNYSGFHTYRLVSDGGSGVVDFYSGLSKLAVEE